MNAMSKSSPASSSWRGTVAGGGFAWLPCPLLVVRTLPALRSSFVSWAKDIHIVDEALYLKMDTG